MKRQPNRFRVMHRMIAYLCHPKKSVIFDNIFCYCQWKNISIIHIDLWSTSPSNFLAAPDDLARLDIQKISSEHSEDIQGRDVSRPPA
jgi:hypothetical protein